MAGQWLASAIDATVASSPAGQLSILKKKTFFGNAGNFSLSFFA